MRILYRRPLLLFVLVVVAVAVKVGGVIRVVPALSAGVSCTTYVVVITGGGVGGVEAKRMGSYAIYVCSGRYWKVDTGRVTVLVTSATGTRGGGGVISIPLMGNGTGGVSTAVGVALSTGGGIGMLFSGGVTDIRVGNGEGAIAGVVIGGGTNTGGGTVVAFVVVVAVDFFGLWNFSFIFI